MPALERPAVTGQHDSTVNVTSLAVFAQCPRRYYLQRYLGWNGRRTAFDPDALPTEDDAEVSASELGSLVHSLLAGKPGEYPEEARSLAAVFEGSELGRAAAASRQSAREWDFILDLDGILVQGVIDLWFEDPSFEDDGGIVVVDYKTDSHVDPAAYAPQLALYALALERATGRTVAGAFLHFLRFGRVVEVPVGPEAIAAVRELAARLAGAQDTLQFPLNPDISDGGHCHSCPLFRGLCPFNPDSLG